MTNQEAIKILDRILHGDGGQDPDCTQEAREAVEKLIDLLRRAEPAKVKVEECTSWGRTYFQPICPKCDRYVVPTQFIGNGEKISYCDSCGQALCWEGVNWSKW